jgi:hypothetical protein
MFTRDAGLRIDHLLLSARAAKRRPAASPARRRDRFIVRVGRAHASSAQAGPRRAACGWARWGFGNLSACRSTRRRAAHRSSLLSARAAKRLAAAGVDSEVRGEAGASDHAPAWVELKEAGGGRSSRASGSPRRGSARSRPLVRRSGARLGPSVAR